MSPSAERIRVRTLFLSDIHLGMRGCQAELLIEFLRHHEAETIFLVGDIVEGWRLTSTRPWPQPHLGVASELLARAQNGARIVYVPGNHDELLRNFAGTRIAGIEIAPMAIHEGADGLRYLVIHGDQFDLLVQHAKWLTMLGHAAYQVLLTLNTSLNAAGRALGFGYWSLSAWTKSQIKKVMKYISQFEERLSAEATRHRVHGVVCGHIHHAADHELFGVRYINAGDWVESCTAVLEHHDGRFEIVRWPQATLHAATTGRVVAGYPGRFRGWIGARAAKLGEAARRQ